MDDARELRQRGIRLAKEGQKDQARELLQQSIRIEPNNEAAWLWLASVARDNRERVFCLEKLLEINPNNEAGKKALEAARQSSGQSAASATSSSLRRLPNAPVTKPPTGPLDVSAQQPGVPVPMPDKIAEAQKEADAVVRGYLSPLPTTTKWVHKTRRRAGESDIIVYRAYVAAGILVVLLVFVGIFVYLLQTNDAVRHVVLGPSATPTSSPTITPTNTPGYTPTPSITPALSPTPSATPPPNLLAASPPALPKATEIYPQIEERAIFDSAMLISQGKASVAEPTLEHERKLSVDTTFSPDPYYYEALAQAQQGKFDDALATLDDATNRLNELPDNGRVKAFLDSGYAQVYWMQAQQDTANGNPSGASDALGQVSDHAQAAITGDKRLVPPYLLMAQSDAQQGKYDDAIQILTQGLSVYELTSSTVLMVAKGQVYLQEHDYDNALYQAFLALYIDPSSEAAYQLEIQTSMTRNRPGDAVLYAQNYLYYYPGSTTAYRLLGEAHLAEHSDDLALQAFNQGLAGSSTDADAQKMLQDRARLYDSQHRYDLALADYSTLFSINNDPKAQLQRMQEAFTAGQYDQALSDAEALTGNDSVSQGIVNLIHGAALVEQAQPGTSSNDTQAAAFLTQAVGSTDITGSPQLRAEASEYLARAKLGTHNYDDALNAINAALAVGDTGSRHYYRGLIEQAQNDKASAISDYEWVLSWSQIYPYPFRVDAQNRLNALKK
ncbi:MAG TPA: tetratricopeptide repeat protein [Phototrophicaceae bacterium]|nr:tetratricopeptide repeat protein [Phototrophicaceae bacterium]